MVNFIVIALLLLLVVFLLFKMNNFRTKMAYIFIVLGISFLFLTGFILFSGKDINLTNVNGVSSALKTYFSWLSVATSNVVKVSSYVVKQEWKVNDSGDDMK